MEEIKFRGFQRNLSSVKGKTLCVTTDGVPVGFWTPYIPVRQSEVSQKAASDGQIDREPVRHAQTTHNCQLCKSKDVTHSGLHYEDGEEYIIYLCKTCLGKYPNKRNMKQIE